MAEVGLDFSGYIADRTRDFTGWEWVLKAIDDWLADPDAPQAFLLTGNPGSGKSAIAARLVQFSTGMASPLEALTPQTRLKEVAATVHGHPTLGEAVREAALAASRVAVHLPQ